MVNEVNTALQLVQALEDGDGDIVLSSHLDLRKLQLQRSKDNLLVLNNITRRLQGACDSALNPAQFPSDALKGIIAEQELLPGQCVIHGIGRVLTVQADVTWVDRIVVSQEVPTKELYGDADGPSYTLSVESGSLYLTRSSVLAKVGVAQGPNAPYLLPPLKVGPDVIGVFIQEALFRGSAYPGGSMIHVKAPTTFNNCTFGPSVTPRQPLDASGRDRVIGSASYVAPPVCFVYVGRGGSVQISESKFNTTDPTVDYNVCRLSAEQQVFLDEELEVGAQTGPPAPSLPGSSAEQVPFLTQENFLDLKEQVFNIENPSASPRDKVSVPVWVLVLAVTAVVVAVLCTAFAVFRRWRVYRDSHGAYHSGLVEGVRDAGDRKRMQSGSDSEATQCPSHLNGTVSLDTPLSITPPHTSSMAPGKTEAVAAHLTSASQDVGHSSVPECSSVLMSMSMTHGSSRCTGSIATTGPADLNVNHSTSPPTLSTFPATTKPGHVGSSFLPTSQVLASSRLWHHDVQQRGATGATNRSQTSTMHGPVKLSLVNADTSFEPSHNELPSSELLNFVHLDSSDEQATEGLSMEPPDINAMVLLQENISQASAAPLALGGLASSSKGNSAAGIGARQQPSNSKGSSRPGSGKQQQNAEQRASPPGSSGRKGSPPGSGNEGSSAKPPHILQQKALQLQTTQKIVKDLKNVPPGVPMHGYFLFANQLERGGQGVVHFVLDKQSRQFAMKFFLCHKAFLAECKLYDHPVLSRFLPQRHETISPQQAKAAAALFQDEAVARASQWPCIVLEQGEDLKSICSREESSLGPLQIRQALLDIGKCLVELHEAGYVHRDIKPSNVIHLPARQVWRLIDCGLAAEVGSLMRVGFTLNWAPPEAVAISMKAKQAPSHEEEYQSMLHTVSPTLDAWSFGVVAYELVTMPSHIRPAIHGTPPEICAQILGLDGYELPWEGANRATAEKQLGGLAEPILGLLGRNPDDRWTLKRFCDAVVNMHYHS